MGPRAGRGRDPRHESGRAASPKRKFPDWSAAARSAWWLIPDEAIWRGSGCRFCRLRVAIAWREFRMGLRVGPGRYPGPESGRAGSPQRGFPDWSAAARSAWWLIPDEAIWRGSDC